MSNRQSYLAKQDANRKSRMAAGLVGDKFPEVKNIYVDMVYLQNLSNPILMLRKVNIFPTSYAYFKMDCMIKECDGGIFDLGPTIRGMMKERKKTLKDSMKCKGGANRKDLGPDHATVEFDITISYFKKGYKPKVPLVATEIITTRRTAAKKIAPKKVAPPAKAAPAKAVTKKVASSAKATQRAAIKKAAIKKAATKKVATKKVATKKAVTKKAVTKKAVTKKAATKKAVTKKAVTKKAATKKAVTKKAVTKKAAVKKKATKKKK